jgi:hypothetical protein
VVSDLGLEPYPEVAVWSHAVGIRPYPAARASPLFSFQKKKKKKNKLLIKKNIGESHIENFGKSSDMALNRNSSRQSFTKKAAPENFPEAALASPREREGRLFFLVYFLAFIFAPNLIRNTKSRPAPISHDDHWPLRCVKFGIDLRGANLTKPVHPFCDFNHCATPRSHQAAPYAATPAGIPVQEFRPYMKGDYSSINDRPRRIASEGLDVGNVQIKSLTSA